MKTRFLLFLLCLAVAAGCALGFARQVEEEEAVAVTAQTLLGDPAAGAGFTGELITRGEGYVLSWAIDFPLDDPAAAQSTFYSGRAATQVVPDRERWLDGLEMDYASVDLTVDRFDSADSYFYSMPTLVESLADTLAQDVAPGESRTQRIRLGDYLDVLPVGGWVTDNTRDQETGTLLDRYHGLAQSDLSHLLGLSVPADFYGDLTLEKDSQGDLTKAVLELTDPTSPTGEEALDQVLALDTVSARAGDLLYFALTPAAQDQAEGTVTIDLSQYQMSPGIYWMETGGDEGEDGSLPMGTLCTYPAGTKILALAAQGDTLYDLHTQGEDVFCAAWDLTTGERLDQISLGTQNPLADLDRWSAETLLAGDYGLVALGLGQVAWMTRDDSGALQLVFRSQEPGFYISDADPFWEWSAAQSGDKIALLLSSPSFTRSFTAWVYDQTGALLYKGTYDFSCLDENWESHNVQALSRNAISLTAD
jgi:hypothetical protein